MSSDFEIDFERIKETFFTECGEHVSNMESYVLELEQNPDDKELMNAIFRAAHSIKGNSGSLGFMEVYTFTHTFETVLDKLRNGEILVTGAVASLMLEAIDCTKNLLAAASEDRICAGAMDKTLNKLKRLLEGGGQSQIAGHNGKASEKWRYMNIYEIAFIPVGDSLKRGLDPVTSVLKELEEKGDILRAAVDTTKLPGIHNMDPETCYLSWEILLSTPEHRDALDDIVDPIRKCVDVEVTCVASACCIKGELATDCGMLASHEPATDFDICEKANRDNEMLEEGLAEDNLSDRQETGEAIQKQGSYLKTDTSTVRVDISKVDSLVNMVGELLISQAVVGQLASELPQETNDRLIKAVAQFERDTMGVQEKVMSIRMLPVATVFNRLKRLVRDLAVAKDKKVDIEITGEETELDKTVVEMLVDPLTHLLRNSVDHGIELPAERVSRGKHEKGTIRLNAYHEGGKVVITVEDDGKGINRNRVIQKAIERGLVEKGAELLEREAYNLIFMPGFSTADTVTDLSGRGVGLDVVKKNIEGLGGSITVDTVPAEYTRFVLELPLTMAVIDGLVVSVGYEKFIIPITAVIESKRPAMDEVKTIEKVGEVVNVRGKYVPLIRLHRQLGVRALEEKPWHAIVVIISVNGVEYGLMADELLGAQQVVIKTVGSLQGETGIAGATILGDGKVSLILDCAGIAKNEFASQTVMV